MPEISQDAFEIRNPGTPPPTPTEIRARSNSLGLKGLPRLICARNDTIPENATLSFGDNSFYNISNNGGTSSGTSTPSPPAAGMERPRKITIGEQDMDQAILNGMGCDAFHGYKRELDHR